MSGVVVVAEAAVAEGVELGVIYFVNKASEMYVGVRDGEGAIVWIGVDVKLLLHRNYLIDDDITFDVDVARVENWDRRIPLHLSQIIIR